MLAELFTKRSTTVLSDAPDWVLELLGTTTTANTGASITPSTALYNVAVFACVRILAETISSLPLLLYERMSGGGKRRAENHRLYSLLHDAPNPEMTRSEMWEALIGHLALRGNAYCEIEYDGGGRPRALWPLNPDHMTVLRVDGSLIYEYQVNGMPTRLPAQYIMHLRGLGSDGVMGYSPIALAREAIAIGLAAEEYGARFYANDSRPGGILTHPGKLSPAAANNLKTSWEAAHKGLSNAQRVAVLEEGVTWQQIGIAPEEAQFLETRKFQVTEIARMFRIPPHMLADLERATFSNIEHQSIEFVVHTIRPWLVRIEQRINQSLLTETERRRYFAEHLVDGLLRGDIQSRYQAYATARQNGWMSANDIRELENLNPISNGDIYLVPLNMIPADQAGGFRALNPVLAAVNDLSPNVVPGTLLVRSAGGGSAENRRRIGRAFRRLVEDAAGRILRREEADIMRQAEKLLGKGDIVGFLDWLSEFYVEHQEFFKRYMLPVLTALADQIAQDANAEIGVEGGLMSELELLVAEYTHTAAAAYVSSNGGQLRQVVEIAQADEADPLPALQTRFDEWKERTPGKLSMIHTVRANGAVTKAAWAAAGISALRWVAYGDSCPYCLALDGQTVAITNFFMSKDDVFEPDGASAPLTVEWNVGHPPLHLGCDCGLAPGI